MIRKKSGITKLQKVVKLMQTRPAHKIWSTKIERVGGERERERERETWNELRIWEFGTGRGGRYKGLKQKKCSNN
ncbi:hypothetical protein ACMBCM_08100, partial [Spiroplasma sp. K1]